MSVIAKFRREKAKDTEPVPPPETDSQTLSPMDRAVRPRRVTPARIAAAIVVLLILAVGVFGYLRYGVARAMSVDKGRITISAVEKATFSDYAPVTGAVAPQDTVFLDTVEGGQVTEVMVEDGAVVEAGMPLAKLKNTRLELEVLGNEAQLTQQQNYLATARLSFQQSEVRNQRDLMELDRQIERTQDQLKRQKPLENQGISISTIHGLEVDLERQRAERQAVLASQKEQRELARSSLVQIQAAVDRMTASLNLVRGNLDNLNVTAPIAGQLTGFNLKVGEVVNPSHRIGQVDSTDRFKVSAMVDEYYLGRIAVGQDGSLEMDGKTYALKVSKVYPDVKERQFQVDLRFSGEEPKGIRRGQTVRPRIELGETAQSLILANGPFYDETGGVWVFVVSPNGSSAARRSVTLGRRNPEAVEVVAGLGPGERVITSSYQSFKDVDRIDLN